MKVVGFDPEKTYQKNALHGWGAGYLSHDYDPRSKLVSSYSAGSAKIHSCFKAFVFRPFFAGGQAPLALIKHALKLIAFVGVLFASICTIWKDSSRKRAVFTLCAIGGSLAALVMTPIKMVYLVLKGFAGIIKSDWARNYSQFEEKVFRVSNHILNRIGKRVWAEDRFGIEAAYIDNKIFLWQRAQVYFPLKRWGGLEASTS